MQISRRLVGLKPRNTGHSGPRQFILPYLARTWLQILNDLLALPIEPRLLHPDEVLLDMTLTYHLGLLLLEAVFKREVLLIILSHLQFGLLIW